VGVFNYWAGQWNKTLQDNLTPNVPQGKVTPIPAIKEVKYIERPGTVYAITQKNVKNVASLFKYWFEFVLDGGKGQTWATFGPEGVFHKVVDGKVQWLPSIQDPKKPFTKAMVSAEIPINKWNSRYDAPDLVDKSLALFQANSVAYGLIPFSEEAMELVPDLNQIRTKYVAKIVFGDLTVKDGMAAYAKETAKYTRIILKELNK
jgi:putative aldouronate transport system substrate-binding protein